MSWLWALSKFLCYFMIPRRLRDGFRRWSLIRLLRFDRTLLLKRMRLKRQISWQLSLSMLSLSYKIIICLLGEGVISLWLLLNIFRSCMPALILTRSHWFPISLRFPGGHALVHLWKTSYVRLWSLIFNSFRCSNWLHSVLLSCLLRFLNAVDEPNHVLIRIWEFQVVFNCLLIYNRLSASVWSHRSLEIIAIPRASLADGGHALIVKLRVILRGALLPLVMREAPITTVRLIKIGILILSENF